MAYISKTEITDKLIYGIVNVDSSYFTRADDALISLASSKGLLEADILTPVTFLVKEWLKCWVGKEVCFDNKGLNNRLISQEDVTIDVYGMKLVDYEKKLFEYTNMLTKEVITGDADTPQEYSYNFGTIYRA